MNTSSTADMYLKELQIKTISESQTNQNVKIILYIIPYVCILNTTYYFLRTDDQQLYFAGILSFDEHNLIYSLYATALIIPALFVFAKRAVHDLFALVLWPVVVIGGVSGTIAIAYEDFSKSLIFMFLYIYLPCCMSFWRRPASDCRA